MIDDYRVVQERSLPALTTIVREYLKRGWELQGGIACDTAYFYQAMVFK